ncbi:MAG: succinyl-diaminopimelate desuccinylase [Candidatus Sericytochromatia bacterium]|nr:succinyl-diaminopimelate desuccinylase [Candidatus Sericytochromatia bacterium]
MSGFQAKGMSLAELTLALCSVPSVTGDEGPLCRWIEEYLAQNSPNTRTTRIGNLLIATPPAIIGRPTIGLFGHLDTVKPSLDQPLGVDNGRVFGCGAADMKGGLAVMIDLLCAHHALQKANLVAVFYDREEGPANENGLEVVFEKRALPPIELGICLEPTDNKLQLGCVGGLHALVNFSGTRAHSARPWQGSNAIYAAVPFLQRLKSRERVAVQYDDLIFYEVMSATNAATSNSRNVIPDRFTLNVNLRFAPGKSVMQAKAELEALVQGEATIEWIDEAPAGDVCLDHPLVAAWQRQAHLERESKQAWTDVARLTAYGIPALNFGPGETAQAHQARESIAVAHLLQCRDALFELLR